MVAPADPKGINKVGAPKSLNYSIESWGFVHGRFDNRRKVLGWGLFLGALVGVIAGAWVLTRMVGNNAHEVQKAQWYRAAQMNESDMTAYIKQHNIKTVLRLVGTDDSDSDDYETDVAATNKTGIKLVVAKLPTSRLPYRSELATLFEALDAIAADPQARPVLVHCRQGSDRTGLVSLIWLHDYQGVDFAQAREQLKFFPYMHVAVGHKVDEFLDMYENFSAGRPGVSIKHWVRDNYFEEKAGRDNRGWYIAN